MKALTVRQPWAVIGTVHQIGCARSHPSPFFQGRYGHVYVNQREFDKPIPAKGALSLWEWKPPADITL